MMLEQFKNKVKIEGVEESVRFKIDETSKTADLLMSRLYTAPIPAFVRELGTNCYEAHQIVGREAIPFNVTLPSSSFPNFSIRDFGPGLSHEDVKNIYTIVGKSTKTESNTLGGFFGIGSKSPMSYTSQFNVTSYHNGQKSIYVIYRDDEGFITMSLFSQSKSDEPSGIEITIPILESDFFKVQSHAEDIYQWFDTRPNIYKNKVLLQYVDNPKIKFAYYDKMGTHYGVPKIKMGNILYPFPNSLKEKYKLKAVLFEVPIGDLEPIPSRETLKESTKTIQYCEKLVENLIQEINTNLNKETKTWFEIFQSFSLNSNIPISIEYLQYQGRKLSRSMDVGDYQAYYVNPNYSEKIQRINNSDNVCFLHLDKRTDWKPKMRKYCQEKGFNYAVLLDKKQDKQIFLDFWGIDAIIPITSVSYVKQKTGPKQPKKTKFWRVQSYPRKWYQVNEPTDVQWYTTNQNPYSVLDLENTYGVKLYKCEVPPANWIHFESNIDKTPKFNDLKENSIFCNTIDKLSPSESYFIRQANGIIKLPNIGNREYKAYFKRVSNDIDQTLLDNIRELFKKCPYLPAFNVQTATKKLIGEYIESNFK